MFKLICLLNAILVLPFAVSVLIAPGFTFTMFGIELGPEGAGVARGYGAAALGWGIVCTLLRDALDLGTRRAVLVASLAFNGAEVLLQVPVALSGLATGMIWATVIAHGVLALLSALELKAVGLTGAAPT